MEPLPEGAMEHPVKRLWQSPLQPGLLSFKGKKNALIEKR